jgi:AcrR family transcriptional regulator
MQEIKTKEKMLHIARTLFWKNGYHATSMRDLAKEYGCKPANIYNFFPNKEEILYEVLLEEMLQIIEPIRHLEDDEITDPVQQLHIIIESHLEVTLSYRRSAKTLFDVTLDNLSPQKRKEIVGLRDTYDRIIRKVIQRGIDSGLFRGTDAKLVSFMIASMITRTRIWFHPKKGVTVAELAEFIFQFSLNGLKGEKLSQPE